MICYLSKAHSYFSLCFKSYGTKSPNFEHTFFLFLKKPKYTLYWVFFCVYKLRIFVVLLFKSDAVTQSHGVTKTKPPSKQTIKKDVKLRVGINLNIYY